MTITVINPTNANAGNGFDVCVDTGSILLTGTPPMEFGLVTILIQMELTTSILMALSILFIPSEQETA